MKLLVCSWLAAAGFTAVMAAQPSEPSFEVASIKRAAPLLSPSPPKPPTTVFYRSSDTVEDLVQFAFSVQRFQVAGGPDGARRDRFEVNAKVTDAVPLEEMRRMVQRLLKDRFGLRVRHEQQEMRYSALRVASSDGRVGRNLQRCGDPEKPPIPPAARLPLGGMTTFRACTPLSDLAALASSRMGVPVLDGTGLLGLWNLQLAYARPGGPTPAERARLNGGDSEVPEFAAAMREQLGLSLESSRGPVAVVVIEFVHPPSEN